MDDETRSHIEMQTQENIEAGMKPEEARYAALRQFGWVESIKDTCRGQRGVSWLENLGQDVRYGARMLRKNSGFTSLAVLTLALGIGANTAIFSVCEAVLLKPLPYSDPDRILMLWEQRLQGETLGLVAPANFFDWREQSRSFSEMAAINPNLNFVLTGQGEAARLTGAGISPNLFSLLGTRIRLGRDFLEEEDRPGGDRVAILNCRTWLHHLRKAVSAIDAAAPLDQVETMEQIVSESLVQPRFRTALLAAFSILALVISSIGIYGVMNYLVIQRTWEFGIRLVVGATKGDVLRLVLGRAAGLIVGGLCLGLLGSVVLARFIASLLYGVTPLDPLTFAVVSVLLSTVALFASYIPARRATRIDPMEALRYE